MAFRIVPCADPSCGLLHGISVVPALPKGRSDLTAAGGRVREGASTPSGARERSESTGGPPARRTSPDRVARNVARRSRVHPSVPLPGSDPSGPGSTSLPASRAGHRHPGVAGQREALGASPTTS